MAAAIESSAGRFLIPTVSSSTPASSTASFACCPCSSSSASTILRYPSFSCCASGVASSTDFIQGSEARIRSRSLIGGRRGVLLGRDRGRAYASRKSGTSPSSSSRKVSRSDGGELYSCKLEGSRSAPCLSDKKTQLSNGNEAPMFLGGDWKQPEFRFAAAAAGEQSMVVGGVSGLVVGGREHLVRLLEEIRSVISKDKQWIQGVLRRVGKGDIGITTSTGDGGGEAWNNNWSRGALLAAVPGVAGLNLSGPQSVLEALGVLAAIITVHEAGHFLAARLQNIHVSKFAIGFGPTLAKYQQKGVEYSLRAFPFGGFVGFPDEDPNSEFSPDDPNLLKNRPIMDRALVISAGVIANIIFAYSVLFVQTVGVGLVERELLPGVMVPEVIGSSAAAKAGVHVGDVVLAVNDYKLSTEDSGVFELVDTIKKSPGRPITLFVQRGAEILGLEVTPDENRDGSGRIGVQLSPNARPHRVKADNLLDAIVKSNREFTRLTVTVCDGLKQIFFNFEKTVDSVSGPVAIVAVGAEVARSDVAGLLQFAAIVNINLAIVNLLPLPALDGGYLAFVLLEALRGGRKLPDGVEQGIVSSGVLLLLTLGIVLMVRDTLNLGFVQQML